MRYITIDTETTVADLDAGEVPGLVCGVVYEPSEPNWGPTILGAYDLLARVRTYLLDPDVTLIGQNFAFDAQVLFTARPGLLIPMFNAYSAGRIRDTQIRQQLLDVAAGLGSDAADDADDSGARVVWREIRGVLTKSGTSLADLAYYYLQRDRYADKKDPASWRMRFGELRGMPVYMYPSEARMYVLADARDTYDVWRAQGPEQLPDECRQIRKALALRLIAHHGMMVDNLSVAKLKAEAVGEYDRIRLQMSQAGFYREAGAPDPDRKGKPWLASKVGTKNKRVVESRIVQAFAQRGLPPPRTDKGNIKQDKDALLQSGDPLLAEFSGAGPIGSIVNTYVPLLEAGAVKRVHSKYNSLLATGRISSAKPNLNNLPRSGGVRECIIATPGTRLVSVDYSTAELRSLGQIKLSKFGRCPMAEFFQRTPRGDPHLDLAANIMGLDTATATQLLEAGDDRITALRQGNKAVNFGFPGGMGIDRFIESARKQYNTTFTRTEAQQRKSQWLRRWDMQRYFDWITGLTDRGDTIEQWAPKWAGAHRVRGGVSFCSAANTLFQGLTADGAADALWRTTVLCYAQPDSVLYGSRPVGFLYDEILLEAPDDVPGRANACGRALIETMETGMREWTPDVPPVCDGVLMYRWTKDKAGRQKIV